MDDLQLNLDGLHLSSNIYQPGRDDLIIAVMGVTGAGKSTFISHCTSSGQGPIIGHDIISCTREVGVYKCEHPPGTSFCLVDTPGFNDTSRTDKQVLQEISEWLGTTYEQGVRLSGIVYFHPISDRRMTGSARKNLLMFAKLCGEGALTRVILATTMWEDVDLADGDLREAQLIETKDFWGFMCEKGSQVFRHYNNKESAMKLLSYFAGDRTQKVILDIQRELVDGHKTLDETRVGKELDSSFAAERMKLEHELKQLKQELKETIEGQSEEMAELIRESQQEVREEMETRIQQLQQDRDELKITLQGLQEQARNAKVNRATVDFPGWTPRPSTPQSESKDPAATFVRYGYVMDVVPRDTVLTWSGNYFVLALRSSRAYRGEKQKNIQILPARSHCPHQIWEPHSDQGEVPLLEFAEIGDDKNYIISGRTVELSTRYNRTAIFSFGKSTSLVGFEWFLQRSTISYPGFNSWANPDGSFVKGIDRSWPDSSSLRDTSGFGGMLSSDEHERIYVEHGNICRQVDAQHVCNVQEKMLARPFRNRFKFLSLGPNGTYYARGLDGVGYPWASDWKASRNKPNCAPVSYELPKSITADKAVVKKLADRSMRVWLGRNGAWVLQCDDLGLKWHLDDPSLYPGLRELLDKHEDGLEVIQRTSLRPYLAALSLDNGSSNWAAVFGYSGYHPHHHDDLTPSGGCAHIYYRSHSSTVFEELENQWSKSFHGDSATRKWRWIDVNELHYDLT